jgi:large subunit ribosomal protein L6
MVIGSLGSISIKISKTLKIKVKGSIMLISTPDNMRKNNALWGITKALINNIILGVKKKFTRKLIIQGLGYTCVIKKRFLLLTLGYSHEILYHIPLTVKINCINESLIFIEGCNKQIVGQVCKEIRILKKPELYKRKGIIYINEIPIRKRGKKK